MVGHMMAAKSDRPPREYVPVRLAADSMQRIRAMAEEETEGNISMMIRKLLTEALQHRDAKGRS